MHDQNDAPMLSTPVDEKRDHILGPRNAPVTLVEFGDYECPHCGAAHYVLKDLMAQLGDRCRLVFRNFPLAQIHPNAQRAAEAAEAAGTQKRFWPMHDMLFEHQDVLADEALLVYADALRLDLEQFQLELLQGAHVPRVREDFLSGVRSGVNGTPTFFINGYRYNGPWDMDSLSAAILGAISLPGGKSHPHQSARPQH